MVIGRDEAQYGLIQGDPSGLPGLGEEDLRDRQGSPFQRAEESGDGKELRHEAAMGHVGERRCGPGKGHGKGHLRDAGRERDEGSDRDDRDARLRRPGDGQRGDGRLGDGQCRHAEAMEHGKASWQGEGKDRRGRQ